MNGIITEILIVIGLILLNGFFSGTEMALISLRKTRIKQLAKEGNTRAQLAEKILGNPEEFLATIQVGITLISTIASAFAGANIAETISPSLAQSNIPFIANNAETISLAIVVVGITYLSLVIGELIPKSLGIKFSERFSLFAVYPIYILSKITFPITKFLTFSTNIILKLFGDKTSFSEAKLTEEELRTILYESHKAGTIKKHEHELLDNVFDFADIAVDKIMTPRAKIFTMDIEEPVNKMIQTIMDTGYSRIPFYRDNIDNIIGVLYVKDLFKKAHNHTITQADILELLKPPLYAPNTQKISNLLRKFQREKKHLAVVTDEHGGLNGIVSIEDILEEIVGEIDDEKDKDYTPIKKDKEGNFNVDGTISIVDFNKFFESSLPEDESYTTISGFLLDQLEKFPNVGEIVKHNDLEFKIKEKTEKQIKTIAVRKLKDAA